MAGLIKTEKEIATIHEGGKKLAAILAEIAKIAKPGVSTLELDARAERLIRETGGIPAFKGYRVAETKIPFSGTLCASINDEVVHGIPSKKRILKEGDLLGIDIGMCWPGKSGLFTDMAITIGIGTVSKEADRLLKATQKALDIGISSVRVGARVGDIGHAIQNYLEKEKLGIIRDLAGHGVGYELHEKPLIPNFGKRGTGPELVEGMVIAIEPMATLGGWELTLDDDEWTFRTADGSLAAHFEHTVAVTKNGGEILTK